MIVFIREETDAGLVLITTTADPQKTLKAFQFKNPRKLSAVATMASGRNVLERIRFAFRDDHKEAYWYRPSERLLAFIANPWDMMPVPQPGPSGLADEEIVKIFRAAWSQKETDAMIGARFGISAVAVGQIARGQTHRHLFKRVDHDKFGIYSIGEAWDGAPQHRLRSGRRSR